MKDFDVVIVGGGLVGASLALALAESGLSLALIEARLPRHDDPRLFALNISSCQFLKNLDLWSHLQSYAAAIEEVHVSYQGRFGAVRLKPQDLQLKELGYVVPAFCIEKVMQEKLTSLTHFTLYQPASLQTLTQNNESVELTIATNNEIKKINTAIVIAADGTHSTVRTLLHVPTKTVHSGQSALITRTKLKRSHEHIAYERFNATGAIAMLPLPADECATIWTADDAFISHLAALSDQEFVSLLQQEFGYRLGRLQQVGKRHTFPLQSVQAEKMSEGRVFLIGNAAHTLSPLAAQGFNLALYEVATLVQMITENLPDIRALSFARLSEKLQTQQSYSIGTSERLAKLFSGQTKNSWQQRFLQLGVPVGMVGLDIIKPLKMKLMSQLLGRSGQIPSLLMENRE